MVYAAVLAGGSGLRMGGDMPKQFLDVCKKPVIIRSIEKFVKNSEVDRVIVSVSDEYKEYTENLIKKYFDEDINVVVGGKNRNETLYNVLKSIDICENDIILTHDAVRPFIDDRIIHENIVAAEKYGACNTVIPAVDTILESEDGNFITRVPDRKNIFHAQTPQSFNADKLKVFYDGMSNDEFEKYTDACTVFIKNGEKVFLVEGDRDNIKITYPGDIEKAEETVKNKGLDE